MISGQDIVAEAVLLLYTPYLLGAEADPEALARLKRDYPDLLDCSELAEYVLKSLHYELPGGGPFPDGSWLQYEACEPKISVAEARRIPGALVFLKGSEPRINHVGISTGTGCTVEARGGNSGRGRGMVNIFPWWRRWDLAGLIPGVEYVKW